MMMMITAFWSNECPCCHDKDQTDNNGNQKNDQKIKNGGETNQKLKFMDPLSEINLIYTVAKIKNN